MTGERGDHRTGGRAAAGGADPRADAGVRPETAAASPHPTHPAVTALVRLLARQAAREAFAASPLAKETPTHEDDDA